MIWNQSAPWSLLASCFFWVRIHIPLCFFFFCLISNLRRSFPTAVAPWLFHHDAVFHRFPFAVASSLGRGPVDLFARTATGHPPGREIPIPEYLAERRQRRWQWRVLGGPMAGLLEVSPDRDAASSAIRRPPPDGPHTAIKSPAGRD